MNNFSQIHLCFLVFRSFLTIQRLYFSCDPNNGLWLCTTRDPFCYVHDTLASTKVHKGRLELKFKRFSTAKGNKNDSTSNIIRIKYDYKYTSDMYSFPQSCGP